LKTVLEQIVHVIGFERKELLMAHRNQQDKNASRNDPQKIRVASETSVTAGAKSTAANQRGQMTPAAAAASEKSDNDRLLPPVTRTNGAM